MLRKKRENLKAADRGCSKLRKLEGNPNITSKRLTIPLGFLGLGVKSEFIRKSSAGKGNCSKEADFILDENLHGLFNKCLRVSPAVNVRRSERILKKKVSLNRQHSASDYYDSVINEYKTIESEQTPKNKERSLLQNNSKSIFREINEKYNARASECHNNLNVLTPPQDSPREIYFGTNNINQQFCKDLSKELRLDFGNKTLVDCKSRILAKIQRINCIISGQLDPHSTMANDSCTTIKNIYVPDSSEDINFQYVPKSQWVYNTPPGKKLYTQKAEDCQMLPAMLCSTKRQTSIYEMKPNLKLDLSSCINRQGIQFEGQFLRHVGSFDRDMDVDDGIVTDVYETSQADEQERGFASFSFLHNPYQCSGSRDDSDFPLVKPDIPDNHFFNLVSRPTKTTRREPRLHNIMKRKLDQTNQPSSSYQTYDQFRNDFSRIDRNTGISQSTKDFKFEFKRKLFDSNEQRKRFSVCKEKPNYFDFSQ